MVITSLTRNQVVRKGSRVRIPHSPLIKTVPFGTVFFVYWVGVINASLYRILYQSV